MVTWSRHIDSPPGYSLQPTGRATLQDKIYVGFVKDASDGLYMGRLKVWIPELSADPNDPKTWFTVNYCAPFAGASNVWDNKNDNTEPSTQRSYGMWFVPPDINNEVVVAFINGDPARGIWLGCLFQQNMNQMVPGIPGDNSQATLPTAEYNKKITQKNGQPQNRPLYPLAGQLVQQGLNNDIIRGVSSAGARRVDPPNSVSGILTPGGSQFVFDEDPSNTYIRLRTANGVQILLNDTTGCIYLNSVDGKNWISMDAGGKIDVYAYGDISLRSQGSLNLRADQDVNIEAGQNINIKAKGTTALTPIVNPGANVPQPTPPVVGPAAMIGDGTAAAIAQRIPGSTTIAQLGWSSSDALQAVKSNSNGSSGIVNGVISVGSNDTDQTLLLANITAIRSTLAASNYVWILPYNSTSATTIKTFATAKGDQIIPLSNYPTNNNIIPRDYNVLSNDVQSKLKPANPSGTTPQQTGSNGGIPSGSATSTNAQSGSTFISTSSISSSIGNLFSSSNSLGSPAPSIPSGPTGPGNPIAAATTTATTGPTGPISPGVTTTSVLVPFLQSVEGKSNNAYWDAASQRTLVSIGYGHQIKQNEYAQGYIDTGTAGRVPVTRPNSSANPPGSGTISDAQATALLNIDVQTYMAGAHGLLGGAWDLLGPYQQAALTSVYYNSPATLSRMIGSGITNFIINKDLQGAANVIAQAGPASVASRRVKESNLYLERPDLLGSGGPTPTPGTGDSQFAPQSVAGCSSNTNNGYIKIQAVNSMHLWTCQSMFLTSGACHHRYVGSSIFDTSGSNFNQVASGYLHTSAGQDYSVGAGGGINLYSTRIDLNGAQPTPAVPAVQACTPISINQQDGILDTLGNVIPVLTETIVYHLPYHEPYDDHGGRNSYGIQNATSVNTKTGLRPGEVIVNSSKPLNLIGTPLANMPAGIYQGAGYNNQNQPVYAYQGPVSNTAVQSSASLQLSSAGAQFMVGFENGSYIPIVVGSPPVSQIGYGHNLTPVEISTGQVSINGSQYSLDFPLSQQLIGQLFQQDMVTVQSWMRPAIANVSVTQTQYDMLCSLAFNIGQNNFTNSQVIKQLKAKNLQNVPNLWMQWTLNGNNQVVPQLIQRRLAEVTKFMSAPFTDVVPVVSNATPTISSITNKLGQAPSGIITKILPNK
jgi:GH24 family phage-related lysozyme (muramidase)